MSTTTLITKEIYMNQISSNPPSFLRRDQVQSRTALGRSNLYAMIKKGDFPKPVKITGARAVAWSSHAIDAWVAARIAGVKTV